MRSTPDEYGKKGIPAIMDMNDAVNRVRDLDAAKEPWPSRASVVDMDRLSQAMQEVEPLVQIARLISELRYGDMMIMSAELCNRKDGDGILSKTPLDVAESLHQWSLLKIK